MPMHELTPEQRARADRERLLLAVLGAVTPQTGPVGFKVDANDHLITITISYRHYMTGDPVMSEHEITQVLSLSSHAEPADAPSAPTAPFAVAQDLANRTRGVVTVTESPAAPAHVRDITQAANRVRGVVPFHPCVDCLAPSLCENSDQEMCP